MTTTSNSVPTSTTLLTASRAAAVVISLATFGFLFARGSWRADNLFLVPDLILCALLLVAALVRGRAAVPMLIGAFGLTAGVLITSVSSYAVDGRIGAASLAGVIGALAMAAALVRSQARHDAV